jgi:hypothetical protein
MDSRVSNGLPIALVLWRYVLVIGPSTKEAAYWVYRTPASAITRTFADFWPRQDLLALAVPTRKIIGHLRSAAWSFSFIAIPFVRVPSD